MRRLLLMDGGVATVAALLLLAFSWRPAGAGEASEADMILDFQNSKLEWRNIDDVVMGGVSNSTMSVDGGVATFSGTVSLENNGGFASVRSAPTGLDLSQFDGVVVSVRGDGHRYGLRLRTSDAFDGVSYQAMIEPEAGQWTELVVPFSDFVPVFRGQRVPNHPDLDPGSVRSVGFIISGRQAGPFRLDIRWIRGWQNDGGEVGAGGDGAS